MNKVCAFTEGNQARKNGIRFQDNPYGKAGEDGYRSGGLSDVSEMVIEQNKIINEQLKLGNIDQMQAAELQKAYTLLAMEAMRNIITKLGE